MLLGDAFTLSLSREIVETNLGELRIRLQGSKMHRLCKQPIELFVATH
jgi:hypothetical protein